MTVRKPLTLTLIAFAIAAPGLASASSLYHPADGEVGMTTHPDHMQSTMSRGDVLQAVEVARRDGTLATLSRGGRCLSKQRAQRRPVSKFNRNFSTCLQLKRRLFRT